MTPVETPARLAICASDAWAKPSSAIASMAQSMICARLACSMKLAFG